MNLIVINLPFNPYIIDLGALALSWHGFFTAVGLMSALYLVVRWSKTRSDILHRAGQSELNLTADTVLQVAPWAILSGIIGARLFHVIDFWSAIYTYDPVSVFYIWKGGIAIYGAVLGGFVGGFLYLKLRNSVQLLNFIGYIPLLKKPNVIKLPKPGVLADLVAAPMILGMAIGRIGDVINGEHFATYTDLPWGIIYTHPLSPGFGRPASHPAVFYELLWDLAIFGLLLWLKDKIKPNGMIFVLFILLYSFGRFFIMFLREDYYMNILGFNQAQVVALILVLITLPIVCFKARFFKG
ncbi:MAG: prolipoprotein diacylglyceryl transferase [Dehalococcoidia bacterium]